ncbi:MAG: lytic transglycosylase domain-containing protein [Pseudomonadota bacterium]
MKSSISGVSLVAAAALCASATPAAAHVIEVSPNGDVVVISADAQPAPAASQRTNARLAAITPHLGAAGASADLSPALIEAVAWAESRFNTHAVSPKGAIGVMQLMPATANALGVDPNQPGENIRGGAAYLRAMLEQFDGNIELALAAYNAGPDAVRRYNGVPPYPETRAFVAAVLGYMANSATQESSP